PGTRSPDPPAQPRPHHTRHHRRPVRGRRSPGRNGHRPRTHRCASPQPPTHHGQRSPCLPARLATHRPGPTPRPRHRDRQGRNPRQHRTGPQGPLGHHVLVDHPPPRIGRKNHAEPSQRTLPPTRRPLTPRRTGGTDQPTQRLTHRIRSDPRPTAHGRGHLRTGHGPPQQTRLSCPLRRHRRQLPTPHPAGQRPGRPPRPRTERPTPRPALGRLLPGRPRRPPHPHRARLLEPGRPRRHLGVERRHARRDPHHRR